MRAGMYLAALAVSAAVVSTGYAAEQAIDQVNQKFSVQSAVLKVGDSLHFTNHDDVTHNINVIDDDGNAEDQGLQKPGEEITKMFDKAGKFEIRCAIHPRMKMAVQVN